MHIPVHEDRDCVDGERPHHANDVALKEDSPATSGILLSESIHHALVLEFTELVRLHEGLNIVKWIVKHPVEGASDTTSNEWNVEGYVVRVAAYWS